MIGRQLSHFHTLDRIGEGGEVWSGRFEGRASGRSSTAWLIVVLYLGTVEKQIEGIEILPWQAGLERMGL